MPDDGDARSHPVSGVIEDGTGEWSSLDSIDAQSLAVPAASAAVAGEHIGSAAQAEGTTASLPMSRSKPVVIGLATLLGWGALFGVGATRIRRNIETDLQQKASASLAAAGLAGATVRFEGRDASLLVPSGTDTKRAAAAVRTATADAGAHHFAGPRSVVVGVDASLQSKPTTTVPAMTGTVVGSLGAGSITLAGTVNTVEGATAVAAGVTKQLPGYTPVSQVEVGATGIDEVTANWVGRIVGEISRLGAVSATVTGSADGLAITGAAPSLAVRDAINAFARTSGLSVTSSMQIERAPVTTAAGVGPDIFEETPADLQQLQGDINALLAESSIQFSPEKATLRADGVAVVNRLAELLRQSTETQIVVVGHTDSNGNEAANVALSVARADAVREELIADGISPTRITTRGEGGSKPLVPNDTPANRRKNRRIEVLVSQP